MSDIPTFIYLALATFWAWETVRYAATRYIAGLFDATRALHPVVVAVGPVLYLGLLQGLACAAVVGLLHQSVERFLVGTSNPGVIPTRTRRRGGLPSLP